MLNRGWATAADTSSSIADTLAIGRSGSIGFITDRDVAITDEYQGHRRMTLTYPVLNRARRILWLVTGDDKIDALARLRTGDESIPGGRVSADRALVVADAAAAGSTP